MLARWTYVWHTDDGPTLGPLFATEEEAADHAFEEWKGHHGGNLGGYEDGTRDEFEEMYATSSQLWYVPMELDLQFVVDAMDEKLAQETERFERAMLEIWTDDEKVEEQLRNGELTRDEVSTLYEEERRKRYECEVSPEGYRYELSSEDYESLDGQEGFENGWCLATSTVRQACGLTADQQQEVEA